MGHIDPTKEVFAQFRANDRPGPIHMLNLVRLRAEAAYPDGRKASGAEAYAAYGRESGPVFERLGGRIVWQGRFELMLIGPQEERWDHCFIAEYPSVAAFAEMMALRGLDRNRVTSDCDLQRAIWKNWCVAATRAVPDKGAPSRHAGEDSGLAAAERWVHDEGMDELGAHSRRDRVLRRRGVRSAIVRCHARPGRRRCRR